MKVMKVLCFIRSGNAGSYLLFILLHQIAAVLMLLLVAAAAAAVGASTKLSRTHVTGCCRPRGLLPKTVPGFARTLLLSGWDGAVERALGIL